MHKERVGEIQSLEREDTADTQREIETKVHAEREKEREIEKEGEREKLRYRDRHKRNEPSPWFLMTCQLLIPGTCWDPKFHKIPLYSCNKSPLLTNSNFNPTTRDAEILRLYQFQSL